jgi:homoserine kinase
MAGSETLQPRRLGAVTAASAPASSANLGPGYDVLALALDLRCRVTMEPSEAWSVMSGGEPADAGAVEMVQRTAGAVGADGAYRVGVESDIPLARGLGSSAALIVAAAGAFAGGIDVSTEPADLLGPCTEVEGHPDNVAAALYGGLVAVSARGTVWKLALHPSLRVLVAVPEGTLSTEEARRATAGPVETGVAARTAARLAFLTEGLRSADPSALAEAAGDELHELRRAHLSSTTGRLIEIAREAGALHAAWSGAGPSCVAFATEESADAIEDALVAELGEGGRVLDLEVDRRGLVVG